MCCRHPYSGDVILGGLFPVHSGGDEQKPCVRISEGRGVHRVEAMLYAIDKINADPNILKGVSQRAHADTSVQASNSVHTYWTRVVHRHMHSINR